MAVRKGAWILIWCIGIAAIIGVTVCSEWAARPDKPLTVSYMPADTTDMTETEQRMAQSAKTEQTELSVTQTTTTAALCRDLNLASAEDLQRVEGIGTALAAEIIAFRDARGGFTRRSELLEISGIGAVLAERILAEFEIPNELPLLTTAVQTAPPRTDAPPAETEQSTEIMTEYPVCFDLNMVTREELLLIPDMTEENADRILSLRADIGHFSNIRELAYIPTLSGSYILDVLADYLYIDEPEGDATDVQDP